MEILNVESREAGEFYLACVLNAKRVKLAQPILLKLLIQYTPHNSEHIWLYYLLRRARKKYFVLYLTLFELYYWRIFLKSQCWIRTEYI